MVYPQYTIYKARNLPEPRVPQVCNGSSIYPIVVEDFRAHFLKVPHTMANTRLFPSKG